MAGTLCQHLWLWFQWHWSVLFLRQGALGWKIPLHTSTTTELQWGEWLSTQDLKPLCSVWTWVSGKLPKFIFLTYKLGIIFPHRVVVRIDWKKWRKGNSLKSAKKSSWQALDKCYPSLLSWLWEVKVIRALHHHKANLLYFDFFLLKWVHKLSSAQGNWAGIQLLEWGEIHHSTPILYSCRQSPLSHISYGPSELLGSK